MFADFDQISSKGEKCIPERISKSASFFHLWPRYNPDFRNNVQPPNASCSSNPLTSEIKLHEKITWTKFSTEKHLQHRLSVLSFGSSVVKPLTGGAKGPGFDFLVAQHIQRLISRPLLSATLVHLYRVVLGPDNLRSFSSWAFGFNCVANLGQGLRAYIVP